MLQTTKVLISFYLQYSWNCSIFNEAFFQTIITTTLILGDVLKIVTSFIVYFQIQNINLLKNIVLSL